MRFAALPTATGSSWIGKPPSASDDLVEDCDAWLTHSLSLGDTYRWKSENVATMEVAEKLGRFPNVTEAAVYGVLVPGHDGRAGCAAIHLEAGQAPTQDFFDALLQYASDQLPRYAVPVFIRLQSEINPMHNQKQNKTPLKKDEINLDAIYGEGNDAAEARAAGKDVMYWRPAALGLSNTAGGGGDRYVVFTRADWDVLRGKVETTANL
jgi:hypothetical protein